MDNLLSVWLTNYPAGWEMGLISSPLDEILSSRAKVRLLRLFSTDPEPMSAREAARRVEMAKRSVDLALRDLVQAGVIKRHGSGAQPTYVLNPHHTLIRQAIYPLFRGARGATEESEGGEDGARTEFFEVLRDAVEVPASTGVVWAGLFGSTAAGTDTPGSDIDLAVVVSDETALEPMRQRLADMLPIIRRQFGRVLSPVVMTREHVIALAVAKHPLVDGLRQSRGIGGTTPDFDGVIHRAH